jgi:hypothetical protein
MALSLQLAMSAALVVSGDRIDPPSIVRPKLRFHLRRFGFSISPKRMDQDHHSASRGAALGGILAIISIGVTLMAPAPQSFIIGALLCWGGALSIAYYHPEFRLVVSHAFHREWGKYKTFRDDTWSSLALFLVVAILPVYFYINRVPENTDITLLFSQVERKKPGIMLQNLGTVTADAARYVGFYWNLDLDTAKQPDPHPVANAGCDFIKAHDGCGPFDLLFNANNLSFPDNAEILGLATIDCRNCITRRGFWVFMHWQHSGWYAEIEDVKRLNFAKFFDDLPTIAKNPNGFIDSITGPKISFVKSP